MAMLGDADAELQGQVLAFWHSALPRTLSERLAAMLSDNSNTASSWVWHMLRSNAYNTPLHLLIEFCLALISRDSTCNWQDWHEAPQQCRSSCAQQLLRAVQKERLEEQWPHSASRLLLCLLANERAYDAPIFATGEPRT